MSDPAATDRVPSAAIQDVVDRAEHAPLDARADAYLAIHHDLLARLDAGSGR